MKEACCHLQSWVSVALWLFLNTSVILVGYSPAEARLGLRATNGEINSAANYINENRKLRQESRQKGVAERIFKK